MSNRKTRRQRLQEAALTLARELDGAPHKRSETLRAWYKGVEQEFGVDEANYASNLIGIGAARGTTNLLIGRLEIDMSDKSKQAGGNLTDYSQAAEGNQTGVSGGSGNTTTMGDVAAYNNMVDGTGNAMSADLRQSLKDGREEIERLQLEAEERRHLFDAFAKLTEELKKPDPKKSILQFCWNGISAFSNGAKALLDLGRLLAATHGIHLP